MATTIGVRDLKNNAPRLVQRAARGERIVITEAATVEVPGFEIA